MCSSISPLTALFSFHWRVEGRLESTRIGGSANDPDSLIPGYRAADPNPIYLEESTLSAERYVRLVRGAHCARTPRATEMPVPRYETVPKSLYESQQRFREQKG
jgi:hypothetical protein